MTQTPTRTPTDHDGDSSPDSLLLDLMRRISRLEIIVAGVIGVILLALVLIEPEILEAPFENWQTLLFTFGGTVLAAGAFIVMLRMRVPPIVRVIVLLVPFAIVNWWLISPYFVDDVVDETFSASISDQLGTTTETPAGDGESATDDPAAPSNDGEPVEEDPATGDEPSEPAPSGPVLLGAGQFVGLAGHTGTGDGGLFENPDGSLVLRFENFDIQNGPDLEVYLVPGADQVSLAEGSIHLGPLKGNIGDQNYDLPSDIELVPGVYTALVWCEAFSVEFVGATIDF